MPRAKGQGKTPGSGRQAGTPNKRSLEVAVILEAAGFDPQMPWLYWARVLKSAMTPPPAAAVGGDDDDPDIEYGEDRAEQFYQGLAPVGLGEGATKLEPIWARATADMADSAAKHLAEYLAPKLKAVEFRSPDGDSLLPVMVPWSSLNGDPHVQAFMADRARLLGQAPGAAPNQAAGSAAPAKPARRAPKVEPVKPV